MATVLLSLGDRRVTSEDRRAHPTLSSQRLEVGPPDQGALNLSHSCDPRPTPPLGPHRERLSSQERPLLLGQKTVSAHANRVTGLGQHLCDRVTGPGAFLSVLFLCPYTHPVGEVIKTLIKIPEKN